MHNMCLNGLIGACSCFIKPYFLVSLPSRVMLLNENQSAISYGLIDLEIIVKVMVYPKLANDAG